LRILLLSIMAKCGVFTHVRDLAASLLKKGFEPYIGFIATPAAMDMFGVSKQDRSEMEQSLSAPCFYYNSYTSLLENIEGNGADLVHAHSPIVLKHATYIKLKMDIPFVATLHGLNSWTRNYRKELEKADRIIAVGPEIAASCGKAFKDKITIIFNGVDTDYFRPDYSKTLNHPLRIIWTGRTSGAAARGAEYLAFALKILKKNNIPFEAKYMGYAFGAKVGNAENCGWVHDPLPLLQWSDMAFGRGRSLREAMACGSAGFLLGEGYGGLVRAKWFEKGRQPQLSGSLKHGCMKLDAQEIARDILFFHKNRDILESARRESRLIAEKHFDVNKMTDETVKIYTEAGADF
jgi:glycosyltransferase involved in cell wall biosynthesis